MSAYEIVNAWLGFQRVWRSLVRQGRDLSDAFMPSLPEADELQEAQLLLAPAFAHAHSGSRGSAPSEPNRPPTGKGGRPTPPAEEPGGQLGKKKGRERGALATDKAKLDSVTAKFANAQKEIANFKKALSAATTTKPTQAPGAGRGRGRKGKGRKGKTGEENLDANGRPKCYNHMKGECTRGDDCKFSHDE